MLGHERKILQQMNSWIVAGGILAGLATTGFAQVEAVPAPAPQADSGSQAVNPFDPAPNANQPAQPAPAPNQPADPAANPFDPAPNANQPAQPAPAPNQPADPNSPNPFEPAPADNTNMPANQPADPNAPAPADPAANTDPNAPAPADQTAPAPAPADSTAPAPAPRGGDLMDVPPVPGDDATGGAVMGDVVLSTTVDYGMKELVQCLAEPMSVTPALSSVYLERAEIKEDTLYLYGKTTGSFDAEALQALVKKALKKGPSIYPHVDEIDVSGVEESVPDPRRQARYAEIGYRAFWHCDYITARRAFVFALIHAAGAADSAPANVLRYWIVLCDLAMGRIDLVQPHLEWLLRVDPLGSRSRLIAPALERVQGHLRYELMRQEAAVLLAHP